MLAYLAPYGPDFAAFAANVSQAFRAVDPAGAYLRILVVLNEQSVKDYPASTQAGPLDKSNAYPKPGAFESLQRDKRLESFDCSNAGNPQVVPVIGPGGAPPCVEQGPWKLLTKTAQFPGPEREAP